MVTTSLLLLTSVMEAGYVRDENLGGKRSLRMFTLTVDTSNFSGTLLSRTLTVNCSRERGGKHGNSLNICKLSTVYMHVMITLFL